MALKEGYNLTSSRLRNLNISEASLEFLEISTRATTVLILASNMYLDTSGRNCEL